MQTKILAIAGGNPGEALPYLLIVGVCVCGLVAISSWGSPRVLLKAFGALYCGLCAGVFLLGRFSSHVVDPTDPDETGIIREFGFMAAFACAIAVLCALSLWRSFRARVQRV
jgi:hypothetical protein